MKKFSLPELPYSFEALEPVISRQTMEFHHGKHLRAYIDNLNRLLEHSDLEGKTLEQIVLLSEGALFNNAAQSWNHIFFFETLTPSTKTEPEGGLMESIEKYFGSFAEFKTRFNKEAMAQFGSGWAWLSAAEDGSLLITTTDNAITPMNQNLRPLLTVDLWEHAYYLDYRNLRAEYLDAIWQKIDWDMVKSRFEKL